MQVLHLKQSYFYIKVISLSDFSPLISLQTMSPVTRNGITFNPNKGARGYPFSLNRFIICPSKDSHFALGRGRCTLSVAVTIKNCMSSLARPRHLQPPKHCSPLLGASAGPDNLNRTKGSKIWTRSSRRRNGSIEIES
jgi:hypothetical protein